MAKPPVIEDKQISHLLKATACYSRMAVRDHAMLLVLYGTAMGPTELASMTVDSYIDAEGVVKVTSAVRADVAHNGLERPFFWSNKKVVAAVDAYLAWRLQNKHGITTKKGAYRGLNPTGAIFLKENGQPYALVEKALPSGTLSYSCNALSSYISRLHSNAGIEGGSAQSATFASSFSVINQVELNVFEAIGSFFGFRRIQIC